MEVVKAQYIAAIVKAKKIIGSVMAKCLLMILFVYTYKRTNVMWIMLCSNAIQLHEIFCQIKTFLIHINLTKHLK